VATGSEGGRRIGRSKYRDHSCREADKWVRRECSPSKEETAIEPAAQASWSATTQLGIKPTGVTNYVSVVDFEGDEFWIVEKAATHMQDVEVTAEI